MKELGLADIDMHALDEDDFEFKESESSSGRKLEEYPFSENGQKMASISID